MKRRNNTAVESFNLAGKRPWSPAPPGAPGSHSCATCARTGQGLQINAIARGYFRTLRNEEFSSDREFSTWLEKRTPAQHGAKVKELCAAAVAKRLAAFDRGISYVARGQREGIAHEYVTDLVDLARRSGLLIVTLSGAEGTKGMISAKVRAPLGPEGIRVNVSPGSTENEPVLLEALARQIRQIPLERCGNAQETAQAVVCLATDENSFIVGGEFVVDGGVVNL